MAEQRPYVLPCSIFGGKSPRTGKPVGSRHRWSGGEWGKGACDYCGKYLDQVIKRVEQPKNR